MAQFISYKDGIEGNISAIKPYYNADTRGKEKRMEIFQKHGIDMNKQTIYPMQVLLNYLKDIAESLGDMNIFLVGRSTAFEVPITNARNLKEVIEEVNMIYHMMYTINGEPMYNPQTKEFKEGIGKFVVNHFDEDKKEMIVISSTPFPLKSDEGFLNGIMERFKRPFNIKSFIVKLDSTKERKDQGGDSYTFIINWQ